MLMFHFYMGTSKVMVVDDAAPSATTSVDCKLCKADIHFTAKCPLPKTRGWRRITAAALGHDNVSGKEAGGSNDARKDNPHDVVSSVLLAICGDSKSTGMSTGQTPKGKPLRGGKRG